ncbi:hypothetical protein [Marinilactibacillus sp. Marseille-P9653]|uniref:hypothetical protein n=1 Tax=Marinilactibacillus sp. Marseille-P9653 TaxID=2866583 RepID=UPI001CE42CF3|nr:hypothetical protein [Marinilactibacillus sp. Marseille-P9653]
MKKGIFILGTVLTLTLFSSFVDPENVEAAEISIEAASRTEVFEVHRLAIGANRIWHSEYRNGQLYQGYLSYYRSYYRSSDGRRMEVYRGALRAGNHLPSRIANEKK